MVTEHSNTVYDCHGCGRPIYWKEGWFHFSTARPCPQLVPVAVRLVPPARVTA